MWVSIDNIDPGHEQKHFTWASTFTWFLCCVCPVFAMTRRKEMLVIIALQGALIICFVFFTRYDPALSAPLPATNTTAMYHYYPSKYLKFILSSPTEICPKKSHNFNKSPDWQILTAFFPVKRHATYPHSIPNHKYTNKRL